MAEMLLVKTPQGPFAPLPESEEEWAKVGIGEIIRVQWTRPRNIRMHRKFFALLNVAFENQDFYATKEQFRHVVQIELGWADPVIDGEGNVHWIPRSISFARMDQSEFDRLYKDTLDLMVRKYVAGADPRELDRAAEEVLRFC